MSELAVLSGLQCKDCGAGPFLKPISGCRRCNSSRLEPVTLSGQGKIHTFTIVQASYGDLKDKAPYCLAVVEIDEGEKLLTVVEDVNLNNLALNTPVFVKYLNKEDIPIFTAKVAI